MRKLFVFLSMIGSTLALSLLMVPASRIVLVLALLGIPLPPELLPLLGAILGVLLIFAVLGAVRIEVNFVELLL